MEPPRAIAARSDVSQARYAMTLVRASPGRSDEASHTSSCGESRCVGPLAGVRPAPHQAALPPASTSTSAKPNAARSLAASRAMTPSALVSTRGEPEAAVDVRVLARAERRHQRAPGTWESTYAAEWP